MNKKTMGYIALAAAAGIYLWKVQNYDPANAGDVKTYKYLAIGSAAVGAYLVFA